MAHANNVLLIVVDQRRTDFIAWLAADFLRTPNVDRLSRVRDYAQTAFSHRMRHAERTLTHCRATPAGLEERRRPDPAGRRAAAE